MKLSLPGLCLAACCAFPAWAQAPYRPALASVPVAEPDAEVVVVNGILPAELDSLPGSGLVIDRDRLEAMNPLTAKEALRLAPGVSVIEEDALGLKLNVSVRGLNPRRSSRTLLMEDGVPIQPAPYADPSAHYYPPLDRVARIEVRHGSGQIPYGPQSVGGMINFVTHAAPRERMAHLRIEGGERGFGSAHLALGDGDAVFGAGLFLTAKSVDGIRDGHDSEVTEAVLRTRLDLDATQALDLKLGQYSETTGLTEGGLDQARFDKSPYYNPFANDQFELHRTSALLTHAWVPQSDLRVSTQLYSSNLYRASYRQADTSVDAMIANPATGCVGASRTNYEAFAPLCGNKMRPRQFKFWGVESRMLWDTQLLGDDVLLEAGARAHFEDTDRKRFNGLTPSAREDSPGTVLRDHNRISTNAYSGFVSATWSHGDLSVVPGLRIEQVEMINHSIVANFLPTGITRRREETTLLPGLGAVWSPTESLTVFAGIHRGFAPPRPDRDFDPTAPAASAKPETSIETEIGIRLRPTAESRFEITLFDMRLEDLIVDAPPVNGRSGGFINAGEALHQGIEASGEWTIGPLTLHGAYSYLGTARFESDVDLGARGVRGNRIPYAPKHMADAALRIALADGVDVEIGVNYLGEQFANASNTRTPSPDGLSGLIPARTLWRASLNVDLSAGKSRLFGRIENLTDEAYISSRVDGLFAGNPRLASIGLAASF
jgi:Fe(3+) dicitrate transport protein